MNKEEGNKIDKLIEAIRKRADSSRIWEKMIIERIKKLETKFKKIGEMLNE